MIYEVLISHNLPLPFASVLRISSKNSVKSILVFNLVVGDTVQQHDKAGCLVSFCNFQNNILFCNTIQQMFTYTTLNEQRLNQHGRARNGNTSGVLHLWLLTTSWKADVALSDVSQQSCPDFYSSLTLNRWSKRQLMKGHACQFQEPPTVSMASCQKLGEKINETWSL